jgi:hypothetical protein
MGERGPSASFNMRRPVILYDIAARSARGASVTTITLLAYRKYFQKKDHNFGTSTMDLRSIRAREVSRDPK